MIYSILPSIIIFTTNILIIFELRKSRMRTLSNKPMENAKVKSNRRMAITQLILASLFLSVTLPRSITVFFFILYRSQVSYFFAKVFDLIMCFYFNSTVFILLVHNKPFRNEFTALIGNESRRSITSI